MPHMIFVGGTGRSGTSIVKELIAAHPDAASLPFEYRFIIDPDGLVDFYVSYTAAWSPYLADRKLKRLERLLRTLSQEPFFHRLLGNLIQWVDPVGKFLSPRTYHGWELNKHLPNFEQHVENLLSKLLEFSFSARWIGSESYRISPDVYHAPPYPKAEMAQILGDFIRDIIDDLLSHTEKSLFVEDNTWNIFFAKELLELLPEAKIIHVYRDPRDVVASFSQQRWSPSDRIQGAHWYKSMMTYWFKIRTTLDPRSYHELSLESLVRSPQETLVEICKFAQIPFDDGMLALDLSHSHAGRWKKEYSEEEKLEVQRILKDVIEQLGYELEEVQD